MLRVLQKKLKLDEKKIPEARWIRFNTLSDQSDYLESLFTKETKVSDLPLRGKVIT